ncbi:HAD hydrolase-like protein [Burkholderia sp. Ac-20379]|uniref:HAD hydrolase-like protein n=1 Tax=Burkholderia sp. Ac-20379 TaxID=2703900 RepID=UPI00197DE960|nr:HAD hydrolase-like protein [Burkholderia sp. Ac-20379]MBN3726760.1 HAD hydrolase-like protein [Burkholderia sp. Ac-20379]
MTLRLAIFDFDGTLADSYPVFADTLNGLAEQHGFRAPDAATLDRMRGMSAMEVLGELALPFWKAPAVLSDARKRMAERIGEVAPVATVLDTLGALIDRQIAVAVATSNSVENVRAVLGGALVDRFAAVESSSSLFGKSQRLRTVLDATGVDAAQAIFIGDEVRDAEAAAGIPGLRFGAVAWGYTKLDALLATQPAMVFREPAELLALAG